MSNRTSGRSRTTLRHVAIGATLWAAVLLPSPVVRTAPVPILEPVTTPAATALATGAASIATVRSRAVRVNLYPLPTPGTTARSREDDLELALFPDVVVNAVFERFETIRGSGTWVGKLDGMPMSSVTLAYRDGVVSGEIHTGRASYTIRPVPDGGRLADDAARPLHVVEETDVSWLTSGDDVVPVPFDSTAAPAVPPSAPMDSGEVIDVMVVFTPAAEARLGGPVAVNNMIALSVAGTNAAYARSGVTTRLRLVHTEFVPFVETASHAADVNSLRLGLGGLSGVPGLRDRYGADIVHLVYYHPNTTVGGAAYLSTNGVSSDSNFGFGVLSATSLGAYVFAHEVGHNLGALHDWYETGDAAWAMPYAYGHVDLANRWRTIMPYNDVCVAQGFNCQVVMYFSNPDVEYVPICADGTVNCDLFRYWFFPLQRGFLGVPGNAPSNCRRGIVPAVQCQADNRRALNRTAPMVANYRQSR